MSDSKLLFEDGEEMSMAEFQRRFKKIVCCGDGPEFAAWSVRIVAEQGGELYLALGTGWKGKVR